jgi:tetratricopeptide (TPR) repeat protein
MVLRIGTGVRLIIISTGLRKQNQIIPWRLFIIQMQLHWENCTGIGLNQILKLGNYQSASDDLKKLDAYTIDDYGSYYWDLGAIAYNTSNYTEAEIQYKKALPYFADIKEKARLYNEIGDCNHSLKNNTGGLKKLYFINRT